jgi:hypothetical protein
MGTDISFDFSACWLRLHFAGSQWLAFSGPDYPNLSNPVIKDIIWHNVRWIASTIGTLPAMGRGQAVMHTFSSRMRSSIVSGAQ